MYAFLLAMFTAYYVEPNCVFYFFSWFYGFQCFFGGAGCDGIFGFYGTLCLFMMITNYIAMSNLTRYSEGATLVALVSVSANKPCREKGKRPLTLPFDPKTSFKRR